MKEFKAGKNSAQKENNQKRPQEEKIDIQDKDYERI